MLVAVLISIELKSIKTDPMLGSESAFILRRYCVLFHNSIRVQGVTFLALGNGAPDVFSAMAAFSRPQTAGLAIGALFGESKDCIVLLRTQLAILSDIHAIKKG